MLFYVSKNAQHFSDNYWLSNRTHLKVGCQKSENKMDSEWIYEMYLRDEIL